MKTILATTYAVNPNKGSEDGMGWNYVLQIARFHRIIAITRENNQAAIEAYMAANPDERYERIQFLYFDLPYWMRFWKKGSRGALLYFYLWQRNVVRFIRQQKLDYDIVHNLNFHNDWTPSFLWKLEKPFVWGHIGHHPQIPSQYLKHYSLKDKIKNKLTWWVKKLFWNNSPSLKNTVKCASHILCMNDSVPQVLDLSKAQYSISPSVATQDYGWLPKNSEEEFNIISAGRFVPLKGFDLSITAFAKLLKKVPNPAKCKLTLVGSGTESNTLKKLVKDFGIEENVQFIDWIERSDLMTMMKTSSVFIFPSHEGAGMVVPEALSFGLPVIALDNCGPGQFIDEKCGFVIKMGNYEETTEDLSEALLELSRNKEKRSSMRKSARQVFLEKFHWNRRGELLKNIYASILNQQEYSISKKTL